MDGGVGSDGIVYYSVAKSIIFNKSIALDTADILGVDGKIYSYFGITYSLVMVPFYLLGLLVERFLPCIEKEYIIRFFVSTINSFVSAGIAATFYIFARKLGFAIKTSIKLLFIYAFTTMSLSYAKTTFCEPLNSLFILCAVLFLYMHGLSRRNVYVFVSGIFLGLGILTKFYDILLIPVAVFYLSLSVRYKNRSDLGRAVVSFIAFLVPVAIFLFLWAFINYIKFGNFFKTGYPNYPLAPFYVGFLGVLFSPGRGLFLYNPTAIVGIWGAYFLYRTHKKETVLFFLIVVTHIIAISLLPIWAGGTAWGPRYLFPIIPYMILPAGSILEYLSVQHSRRQGSIVTLLVALGFLVQIPSVLSYFGSWETIVFATFKITDEMFFFTPHLSTILGSWVFLLSACSRIFMGHSLMYPLQYAGLSYVIDLRGYDKINLWFIRIFSVSGTTPFYLCVCLMVGFLVFGMVFSLLHIRSLLRCSQFD